MNPLLVQSESRHGKDDEATVVDEVLRDDDIVHRNRRASGECEERPESRLYHQHQRGGRYESDTGGAYAEEGSVDVAIVSKSLEASGDDEAEYEGGKHHCGRCEERTEDIATRDGVPYIGGAVDSDGAWGYLAYGYDVGELLVGQPAILVDHFVLDEREHRIASPEAEETNLDIDPKEL